jgi:hypothetical protein
MLTDPNKAHGSSSRDSMSTLVPRRAIQRLICQEAVRADDDVRGREEKAGVGALERLGYGRLSG